MSTRRSGSGNARTDVRPRCVSCGDRWWPPEGIDATKQGCEACTGIYDRPVPRAEFLANPDRFYEEIKGGRSFTIIGPRGRPEGVITIPEPYECDCPAAEEAKRLRDAIGVCVPTCIRVLIQLLEEHTPKAEVDLRFARATLERVEKAMGDR